ncbi:Ovochymase-1 [Varanus komodoensis]|nr:Ovochymase-1 [Varanus komodoensis]
MSLVYKKGPGEILVNNAALEASVLLKTLMGADDGQGCPSELVLGKPRGVIFSPCCSQKYTGTGRCLWLLRISPGGMAKLIVRRLSILETENCRTEFLAIYEESQQGRKILAKLCGTLQSPMTLLSPGPVVKVELRSTIHGILGMTYVVLGIQGPKMGNRMKNFSDLSEQLLRCRDVILEDQEGIIKSPGFPDSSSNTTSCHWRIVGPFNAIIRLDFLDFVIEESPSKCHGGLAVYEGFGSTMEVLGNFCNKLPHYPLKSRGPVVTLLFTSRRDTNVKGFVLAYRTLEIQPSCNGIIQPSPKLAVTIPPIIPM